MPRISFNEITGLHLPRLEFLGNSHGEIVIRIFLVIGRSGLPVLLFENNSLAPRFFCLRSWRHRACDYSTPGTFHNTRAPSSRNSFSLVALPWQPTAGWITKSLPLCVRGRNTNINYASVRRLNRLFQIALLSRFLCLCFALNAQQTFNFYSRDSLSSSFQPFIVTTLPIYFLQSDKLGYEGFSDWREHDSVEETNKIHIEEAICRRRSEKKFHSVKLDNWRRH